MKIIDLLVDKVNGKQLPNKIKANGIVFILDKDNKEYKREDEDAEEFYTEYMIDGFVDLTDEVEIIEEDKKIRKIKVDYSSDIEEKIFYDDGDKPNHCILGDAGTELLINKINEIIDKLEENE